MAEFQFKSGVKTLDVKSSDGTVIKQFSVNVGQKEQTKKWLKEIQGIEKLSSQLSKDESVIDELERVEQKVVSSILGDESWTILWTSCEQNVFSMLGFVKYLSSFLNESMEGFYKDYV